MRRFAFSVLALFLGAMPGLVVGAECPSTVAIVVESSKYSGGFSVELRRGTRPGSRVVARGNLLSAGQLAFPAVCPGRYFFSLGTDDSDSVNVTRYFDVQFDGESYNNPTIRVFYSRGSGQAMASSKRKDL